MKNCNKILVLAFAALTLAACGDKAHIKGNLTGAPGRDIVVKQLEVNTYRDLDTIKTQSDGSFRYDVKVAAGQPEFIYLYYGNTRIAALLLEKGETATVQADTLGTYTVTGSEGSAELAKVDQAYARFIADLQAHENEPAQMTRDYIQHYRACVKYVMEHPFSLTTVPVFFERLGDANIFSQTTDAILFRQTADSLKTIYPDSRYVKALEKEADRRMRLLDLNSQLQSATELAFPDIALPDMKGERQSLSKVDAKVILVHFWDATDAAQKMLNVDQLLPLYKEFHGRGFEIYAIGCSPEKPDWASTVLAQKLPWINVYEGLGTASSAINMYHVTSLPNSFLIVNGELSTQPLTGSDGLRRELARLLK